jgi:hypothetical protein
MNPAIRICLRDDVLAAPFAAVRFHPLGVDAEPDLPSTERGLRYRVRCPRLPFACQQPSAALRPAVALRRSHASLVMAWSESTSDERDNVGTTWLYHTVLDSC